MISKDSKILVTGFRGQLGYDCVRELKERGYNNVLGIDRDELDITDEAAVKKYINDYRPDVVMHNAAWTAVDKAEQMPEAVYAVNALGPKYIAEACKEVGATMFYISTDYVFNGLGANPFEVNDPKEGLSVYGKTKAKGEDFVRNTLDKHFIIRISWAFGFNGNNFIKTMLKLADMGKTELNIVCDQVGSPTYTYDLSKLMCDMMVTEKYGTYHATNEGFTNWAEFASYIFKTAGIDMKVNPVTTEEYKKLVSNQADRPLNSRLSKKSLDITGFKRMPSWQSATSRYIRKLLDKKTILVTGANGYLGVGIINELLKQGYNVVASDFALDHVDERAIKKVSNLFEVEDPYNYYEKPDVMLHLAWRDGFRHSSDAHFEDLPKHYHFIKKMAESGVKQIATMGSMHEVGFYEGCIDENTPCHPENFYGIAKNALRDVTKEICKEHEVIFQWLRGYYIVGNSKFGSSIFSKITAAVAEGKKEFPFTTGKNKYDFLNYEDFCYQVAKAVSQNQVNGIINICSGNPVSLAEKVEQFIKENNYDIQLKYGAFPDRPYDSKAIWGDNSKIQKILKGE